MALRTENKKEKDWRKAITEYTNFHGLGFLYPSYKNRIDYQRHHVLGKSYKQNKVLIGYYFIIPVPFELHDISSDHQNNVTHFKKRFVAAYGKQRCIFKHLVSSMRSDGYEVPPDDVLDAIEATSA